MINLFWNFFNHTTHLFNEPWSCSNHAFVVILTKHFFSVLTLFNSLTSIGYLLEVFFRLWIHYLVCISTSAGATGNLSQSMYIHLHVQHLCVDYHFKKKYSKFTCKSDTQYGIIVWVPPSCSPSSDGDEPGQNIGTPVKSEWGSATSKCIKVSNEQF